MVDNPFGKPIVMPSVITPIAPIAPDEPSILGAGGFKDEPLPVNPNEALATVQRILAEHNNIESDIPVNCFEYWYAKRSLA